MITNFPKNVIYRDGIKRINTNISNLPKKLFYEGNIELLSQENKILCVVGSRKYNEYGLEITQRLISGLIKDKEEDGKLVKDIVILSGLAIGIDSIAIRTAIDVGLKVIALPGSGLGKDFIYPKENYDLSREILENGGLLLSQFKDEDCGAKWMFPVRNKTMAEISDKVLIVQCKLLSGTMSTSKHALDQGKDIMTVPGSIFSELSEGPHFLLKKGAIPITSSEEILDNFYRDKFADI